MTTAELLKKHGPMLIKFLKDAEQCWDEARKVQGDKCDIVKQARRELEKIQTLEKNQTLSTRASSIGKLLFSKLTKKTVVHNDRSLGTETKSREVRALEEIYWAALEDKREADRERDLACEIFNSVRRWLEEKISTEEWVQMIEDVKE